jgi:hypothetical protein
VENYETVVEEIILLNDFDEFNPQVRASVGRINWVFERYCMGLDIELVDVRDKFVKVFEVQRNKRA